MKVAQAAMQNIFYVPTAPKKKFPGYKGIEIHSSGKWNLAKELMRWLNKRKYESCSL